MTTPQQPTRTAPPRLDDLLGRFIASTANSGERLPDASEVELHEIHGGFQADATLLWTEARRVFDLLGTVCEHQPSPPEWQGYSRVAGTTPAIPLAAGFFPQRLQDVQSILGRSPAASVPAPTVTASDEAFPKLRAWATEAVHSDFHQHRTDWVGCAGRLGRHEHVDLRAAGTRADCAGWPGLRPLGQPDGRH